MTDPVSPFSATNCSSNNSSIVKIQPDDADWDAGDIRYNVLRWTSSPQPPFGGYGPSFTNPRTGQILGADIMLEYAGVIRRVRVQQILDSLGVQASAVPVLSRRGNQYTLLNQDAEVAAFVRSKLGKVGVKKIAQLCRDRFGPDRAPSKSTIWRYWQRLRRAQDDNCQ